MTGRLVRVGVLSVPLLLVPAAAWGGAAELKRALEQARQAAQAGDGDALDRALRAALAEGGKPPVKGLLELAAGFPAGREPLYWQVVGGVASVTDRGGLDAVGDFLQASGDAPLARDLMLALQGNRSAEVLELHRRLLRPRSGPLQLLAVDRLGELERPEAIDLLLEVLKREEGSGSALERRVRSTLAAVFGEDMGDRLNWEGWWAQNRDTAFGRRAEPGSTGTVKDQLDRARSGGLASMSRRGGKVLVLRGSVRNFDEIEGVLERLGVRHEVMLKTAFNADPAALDGVAALIMNCSFFGTVCRCRTCKPGQDPKSRLPVCTGCDTHDLTPDALDEAAVRRIKAFVAAGGCVFTEDYGLKELTGKAWSDYVTPGVDLKGGEVDYAPVPGQVDPSLLRGVLAPAGADAGSMTARRSSRWKIDDLSPAIVVAAPERVQVLLASQELKPQTNGVGAVAVCFSPGGTLGPPEETGRRPRTGGARRRDEPAAPRPGLVLHVLSHFGKQQSLSDEFTLQNLLVNFLLEAQDRFAARR
ncbi:MAG: hypothetical protein M9894_10815 [Planctomycetes bacterium]|nr:hypothetical protein [Planctomycetota bacterium]